MSATRHRRSTSGSTSVDDYLEQIHKLITEKGYARVVDIAKNLGISQASVTNMVKRLAGEGLVVYEKYRGMVLTPDGRKIAEAVARRHKILTDLLRPFPIEKNVLHEDVEGMEHHISSATLKILRALSEELAASPRLVKRVSERAAGY